jgi:hypothetical protein
VQEVYITISADLASVLPSDPEDPEDDGEYDQPVLLASFLIRHSYFVPSTFVRYD